jgi:hypothetical protein
MFRDPLQTPVFPEAVRRKGASLFRACLRQTLQTMLVGSVAYYLSET